MDKKRRRDPFWFVYRIVLSVLLVCGACFLIWLGMTLKEYQETETLRESLQVSAASEHPFKTSAPPSPSPTPRLTPTESPPTPTPTPTASPTPSPTEDPLFAQTEGHVRMVSEEIAAFVSGKKDFHEIAHFFADGTATKKTLSNFVNEYYIHLTSYELSQWQITDWKREGDEALSCRVQFLLTAYWEETVSGTDQMDYQMTLRKIDGEWLIYELKL